jgi:hypothetical protein
MNVVRPCVNIYRNHEGEAFIKEVLAGFEEEGVPFEVHIRIEENAEKLAHSAATASILEVGVGIDKEFICVTLAKLPPGEPLLKYRTAESENLRLSGSNAARLVKGIKLKL